MGWHTSSFNLEDNLPEHSAVNQILPPGPSRRSQAPSEWNPSPRAPQTDCRLLVSSHKKRYSPPRHVHRMRNRSHLLSVEFLSPVFELSWPQGQNGDLETNSSLSAPSLPHSRDGIFQASFSEDTLWVTWSWNALLRSMHKSPPRVRRVNRN